MGRRDGDQMGREGSEKEDDEGKGLQASERRPL